MIIDNREKRSIIPQKLTELGVEIEYATLPIGDYLINNTICVERKEINDYVGSLTSGHLHTQLYQMSTNFDCSYLIVEGIISEVLMYRKIKRSAYISSLVGASLKRSPDGRQGVVQLINLETPFDTVLFLKSLEEKSINNEPRLPKLSRVNWGTKDRILYLISSITGIGEKKAMNILNYFGTVKNFVNASVDDLMKVEGIGQKIAENIFKLLNTSYRRISDDSSRS